MAYDKPKRIKKLVSFRELEREQASIATSLAKTSRDNASERVRESERVVETAAEEAAVERDKTFSPEEATLALACLELARTELSEKKEQLRHLEAELEKAREHLLASHLSVKQMEVLYELEKKRLEQSIESTEQREIDDLATTKEARK